MKIDFHPHAAFEVYSEKPDVFACVEHQRGEIAHRRSTRNALPTTDDPFSSFSVLPGIAKVVNSRRFREGLIIVITSRGYEDESIKYEDYLPDTGALWVTFNRKFPWQTVLDQPSRYVMAPKYATHDGSDSEEPDVCPEANEINVRRLQYITEMKYQVREAFVRSHLGDGTYDYGLDKDESRPMNTTELSCVEDVFRSLGERLSEDDFAVAGGPADAVTITSSTMGSEPDIRYIVYIPFLCHHEDDNVSLDLVARAFTSTVVSHLPGKTIHFEFHKPPNTSMNSAIALQRQILESRPQMSVGALARKTTHATQREYEPYKVFAVVLDKPDFIDQSGVLFVLTDGGKKLEEPVLSDMNPDYRGYSDYDEIQVWRSAGMAEVAKRLSVLVESF